MCECFGADVLASGKSITINRNEIRHMHVTLSHTVNRMGAQLNRRPHRQTTSNTAPHTNIQTQRFRNLVYTFAVGIFNPISNNSAGIAGLLNRANPAVIRPSYARFHQDVHYARTTSTNSHSGAHCSGRQFIGRRRNGKTQSAGIVMWKRESSHDVGTWTWTWTW